LTPHRSIFVLAEIADRALAAAGARADINPKERGHNADTYFKDGGFAGVSRLNLLIINQ
jgi:hypothetical protein